MEYRRRSVHSRRRRRGSAGGGLRAFILIAVLGAALYLLFGTGLAKKLKEGYARSLLSSCVSELKPHGTEQPGFTAEPGFMESEAAASPTPAAETETSEVELPALSLHMLQMGFYESEAECMPEAQKLREKGAAGYIYDDNGSLRLIAAAYSDKDSAQSVLERLTEEGFACTIYSVERSGAELLITASPEMLAPIRRAFALCPEAVERLEELSLDFDSQNRSIEYGMQALSELRSDIRSALSGISTAAEGNEMLSKVCAFFTELTEAITETADRRESVNYFTSSLKNLRVEAGLYYFKLLENIGA